MSYYATRYIPTQKEKETRARMKRARLPLVVEDKDCTTTYHFFKFEGETGSNYIVETEIEYHDEEEVVEEDEL